MRDESLARRIVIQQSNLGRFLDGSRRRALRGYLAVRAENEWRAGMRLLSLNATSELILRLERRNEEVLAAVLRGL